MSYASGKCSNLHAIAVGILEIATLKSGFTTRVNHLELSALHDIFMIWEFGAQVAPVNASEGK